MAKKISGYIKLEVPAGQAAPSQALGPALGQRGLNIMDFCKGFNAETQSLEPGMPVPVVITAYEDRSFTFVTKTAPASYFLRKTANINKGANVPGREVVAEVTTAQLKEIAEAKMKDLNANDIDAAIKIIAGSAQSMGIRVID